MGTHTGIVNLQKLLDAAVLLQAELFAAQKALKDSDLPELQLAGMIGTDALDVDCSILGLDDMPKELGPQGREDVKLILDTYRKGYRKFTQTLSLSEDDAKILDAKVPGWKAKMQSWPTAFRKMKAILTGNVCRNSTSLICWDGKALAATDHPSYYQGGQPQSNLLTYKFGKYALRAAILAFEALNSPWSPDAPLFNVATHIGYSPNIQFDVLEQTIMAVLAGSGNVMLTQKLVPIKMRRLPTDSFELYDLSGAARPVVGVYDNQLGEGLEFDQDDSQWFDKRILRIGTLGKVDYHPAAWFTMLHSTGAEYHDLDAPAE